MNDDVHNAPNDSAARLWANDALQLLFVMSGNPNGQTDEIVELAVADTPHGPKAAFTFGREAGFTEFPLSITRREGRTVYELAIPWKLLQPGFRPGESPALLFNLAVSDNDGKTRQGIEFLNGYEKSVQMSKGVVDEKNPATAPRLCFVGKRPVID